MIASEIDLSLQQLARTVSNLFQILYLIIFNDYIIILYADFSFRISTEMESLAKTNKTTGKHQSLPKLNYVTVKSEPKGLLNLFQ